MKRHLLFLSAAAVLLTAAAGCSSPAQREAHWRAQARADMRSGRYAAAVIELRNALRIAPQSAALHVRLARAYAHQQQFGLALGEYRQAIRLRPADAAARLAAGRIELAAGQTAKAQAEAQAVLAQHPGDGEATILLAAALARQGKAPKARQLLRALAAQQPRFQPGLLALGAAELAGGDPEGARATWNQVLAINSGSLDARRELAGLDLAEHHPGAAERELLAAVRAHPRSAPARGTLAMFYAEQHHPRRAEAALRAVVRLERGAPAARFALARFLASQGHSRQAKAIDVALARAAPNFLPARLQRIEIDFAQGRTARARSLADALAQEHPHQAAVRLLRARIEMAQGQSQAALQDLTAAHQLNSGLPAVDDLLGQAYTQLQQPMKAVASYQRSLRAHPRDALAAAALARLLLGQGHPNQALDYATQASAWRPQFAGAWLVRGDAEAQLHQNFAAAKDWRQAEQVAPRLPQPYLHLGGAYLRGRDYPAAEQQFQQALRLAPGDPAAVAGLANVQLAQGHSVAALQLVRGQIRQRETAPLDELLASLYAREHQTEAAEQTLQRAVRLSPASLTPYLLLASLYAQDHKLSEAEAAYAAALRRHPHNAGLWTMLGMMSEQGGDEAKAQRDYRRALAIAPDSGVANNNLAYLYAKQGRDLPQALVLAQRALHALPNVPTVADTLATVYLKMHLNASAIALLRPAVEQQPQNAMFHFHLAEALFADGHKRQARVALSAAVRLNAALRQRPEAQRILAAH
jgi:tetratricopeptide (TPR) repeat protein